MALKQYCVKIDGVNAPCFFSEECFRSALEFKPDPGDIFVVTYPKCGTTWMQNLILNILRRGKSFDRPVDFFWASPFLEQLGADDSRKWMIPPGVFKTHLPHHKCPWSDDCKYVYVARHPKDACVSYFHHLRQIPLYEGTEITLDHFVQLFVSGDLEGGQYFDHLIPWYEKRHLSNVYFTTYEQMSLDLRQVARDVSAFLGHDPEPFMDRILNNCSFPEMKKFMNAAINTFYEPGCSESVPRGRRHMMDCLAELRSQSSGQRGQIDFVRKGKVGGWKSELAEEQSCILEDMIRRKTLNSDVMTLWEEPTLKGRE